MTAMSLIVCLFQSPAVSDQEFWDAVHSLNLEDAVTENLDAEHETFARGLELMLDGRFWGAESCFTRLILTSRDSLMVSQSQDLLQPILVYTARWDSLLSSGILEKESDQESILPLVQAYSTLPAETYTFSRNTDTLPLEFIVTGSPLVEVEIGGRKYKFLLDTGASPTVISSKVARQCGISPLSKTRLRGSTSTKAKVVMKPACIDSMEIGGLNIRNHYAVIMNTGDLNISIMGINLVKLDGIIGWNAIQNMDVELNYVDELIVIRKPAFREAADKNFFWIGKPVVKAYSTEGIPVYSFLDTGANFTELYEAVRDKIAFDSLIAQRSLTAGAGGWEARKSKQVSRFAFVLDEDTVNLRGVSFLPDDEDCFVRLDGFMGVDMFSGRSIRLDILNGRFDVNPAP